MNPGRLKAVFRSKFRRLIPTRHHNKEVPDEGEWCSSNLWSSPASFRFCRTSKKSGLKALREEVWERGKKGNGLGWDEKSKNFKFKMKWETEKVWIGLPQLSTPGYWQTYCHPWLTVGHDLNKHFEFFKIIWAKIWRILDFFTVSSLNSACSTRRSQSVWIFLPRKYCRDNIRNVKKL